LADAAHRPRPLCSFTINNEEQARSLFALGVSAIQSDFPGMLRRVLDAAPR
jgi:glycerophosphoryl diester phosphodiesterase